MCTYVYSTRTATKVSDPHVHRCACRVRLIVLPLSLSVTELHETTMMPLEEVEPRRFEFRDALDDNFVFVAQQENDETDFGDFNHLDSSDDSSEYFYDEGNDPNFVVDHDTRPLVERGEVATTEEPIFDDPTYSTVQPAGKME